MFPEISRDDVFRLETRRLWMRWPTAADAPDIFKYAGDIEVARWLAVVPHPYPRDAADAYVRQARLENLEGRALHCAMALKPRPQNLIGMASLSCIDDSSARLGYWLGAPHWGAGLIGEALSEFLLYLRRFSTLVEIEAQAMIDNEASHKTLKSLGFVDRGESFCAAPARGGDVAARTYVLRLKNAPALHGFAPAGSRTVRCLRNARLIA